MKNQAQAIDTVEMQTIPAVSVANALTYTHDGVSAEEGISGASSPEPAAPSSVVSNSDSSGDEHLDPVTIQRRKNFLVMTAYCCFLCGVAPLGVGIGMASKLVIEKIYHRPIAPSQSIFRIILLLSVSGFALALVGLRQNQFTGDINAPGIKTMMIGSLMGMFLLTFFDGLFSPNMTHKWSHEWLIVGSLFMFGVMIFRLAASALKEIFEPNPSVNDILSMNHRGSVFGTFFPNNGQMVLPQSSPEEAPAPATN